MKKETKQNIVLWFILLVLFLLLLSSCKSKVQYVPVESVKTEYKDRVFRDSLHIYDSIFVKMANDTVWMEKYRYAYRDKLIRDSIFITDSIRVPFPVIEYKEINKLTRLQIWQIYSFRILLSLLFLFGIYRFIKWRFFHK